MTNIEKLYKLAKVESCISCPCIKEQIDVCINAKIDNTYCANAIKIFPPFTAEKQLEIIKYITHLKGEFVLNFYEYTNVWICNTDKKWEMHETWYEHTDFSQALAGLVCELWEDLTQEQKLEVKEILQ